MVGSTHKEMTSEEDHTDDAKSGSGPSSLFIMLGSLFKKPYEFPGLYGYGVMWTVGCNDPLLAFTTKTPLISLTVVV